MQQCNREHLITRLLNNPHVHIHTHAYTHAHARAYTRAYTHAYTHTYMHTHAPTRTHTLVRTHARARTFNNWARLIIRICPQVLLVAPSIACSLQDPEGLKDDLGGETAKFIEELKSAKLVCIIVYSENPRHYTYLEFLKNAETWQISYKDSLKTASESALATAARIMNNIGLKQDAPLKPSNVFYQEDGWSCGLWALKFVEAAVRKHLGEPRIPDASIADATVFINKFINFIKNDTGKAKAKAKPKATGKLQPYTEVTHKTFEDALAAALLCTKCEPTKLGTKGCSQCMGKWFEEIRVKRAPAKFH